MLLPTQSLDTVPPPGNGLTAGGPGQGSGQGSGLFPGLRVGSKQTKARGRCAQSFLDAANRQNLTFLVQVGLSPAPCLCWSSGGIVRCNFSGFCTLQPL